MLSDQDGYGGVPGRWSSYAKQTRYVNRSIWVWWRTWVLCRPCKWVPDLAIIFLCVSSNIYRKQCNLDHFFETNKRIQWNLVCKAFHQIRSEIRTKLSVVIQTWSWRGKRQARVHGCGKQTPYGSILFFLTNAVGSTYRNVDESLI